MVNGLTVVAGEFVVEVVIPLSHCHECGEHMVPGCSAVIKWLLADPMRKTVHTERGLLDEARPHDAGIYKATPPVSPAQARNQHRESPCREQQELAVVLVLEDNNGVAVKIGDISAALDLGVVVQHHPADMREDKASERIIWIFLCVGPAMMGTVISTPPSDTALDRPSTRESKNQPQWQAS